MIPKQLYKIKQQKQSVHEKPAVPRCTTQYHPSKNSLKTKNKLTKGCQNYDQIKGAYSSSKQGERECHLKTDYNQCTFQPKISGEKKNSRSFKQFIEDQENFQSNKENKIRQFKTEATKAQLTECTSRPQIDRVSKRICTLMNYSKQQVVERLYKQKTLQQYQDDEDLFSPKILPKSKSLKRNQNITQLLHQDAIRRKQKLELKQAERNSLIPQSPSILSNTYQLVTRKLYNQFCQLAPEEQPIIPIVIAWAIISQIFGIELNPNKQGREGKICAQMTKYLCNDDEETVNRQKLWDFIQIIIKKNEAKTKFFPSQIQKIIQNFGNLYTCRIAKPKTQRSPQQFSFFPQTLRKSNQKAQKYRQKILVNAKQFLQNQNSKVFLKEQMTIQDIFSIQHLMKKASLQKKKISKEKQMMKQCTFKPRLSQTYKKPSYLPPKVSYSRSKYLQKSKNTLNKSSCSQSLSVTQSFLCASLKSQDFVSNSKHRSIQNTFIQTLKQPLKSKENLNTTSRLSQIKNMDKSVLRMTIARKDRELSNQLKSRGYPKNIQNWTEYTHQEKIQIAKQHRKLKGLTYKKITLR